MQKAGCFLCTTVMPMVDKLWSQATNDHFKNARVEFLKGVRSLIDIQIQALTPKDEAKGSHVVIE